MKGAIAISIHTLTPWHLHDTNLSPPSHTIPESNLGPSTIEQRLLHRTHEERNTTDYLSHVPRGLQERNSPAAQGSHSQCIFNFSTWVYRKTDNLPKPRQFHSDWTFKDDIHYLVKVNSESKGLPRQAEVAQGVLVRLRPRIFLTFRHYKGGRSSAKRTGRLHPRRSPWYSLSEAESTSGHMVLLGYIYDSI